MKHTKEATRIVRETLQPMGNDAPLEFGKAYAALISTTEELLAAKEEVAEMGKALAEIRDSVLNERGPMAEMDFGNDRINAVLSVIDDLTPESR